MGGNANEGQYAAAYHWDRQRNTEQDDRRGDADDWDQQHKRKDVIQGMALYAHIPEPMPEYVNADRVVNDGSQNLPNPRSSTKSIGRSRGRSISW
jgi:hypothetical protein